MEARYYKHWSAALGREMEYKTFGNRGRGVLVFPSQDQRFWEWEDNGMVDGLAPMIESGLIHLICCDSIDKETWSVVNATPQEQHDYRQLIELHEHWYEYITEELIPEVNGGQRLIVTGCSMGGYHAGNVFFRRPDLFDTLLSLSGLFHADYFFPGFTEELIYRNSPLHYLRDQNDPSVLLDTYRDKQIILCCGQGEYEGITNESTCCLGDLLTEKGIPHWTDIWGCDVSHSFEWWRKQAKYFFEHILEEGGRKVA